MKKIAVFFEQLDFDDYPFDQAEYRDAYHEFAACLHGKGGQLIITRGDESYLGSMRFAHGWIWNGEKFEELQEEFEASVIYDKSNAAHTPPFRLELKSKILNPNPIVEICNDKTKTYQLFEKFSPKITIALDDAQLDQAVKDTTGKCMVMKPLNSEGGDGVTIGSADKLRESENKFPVLIQEFIDTSSGIPDIDEINSHHDFRIVMIDGEIVHALARTPAVGSLTANIAQGGASHEIPLDKIPQSAMKLAQEIDEKFKSYRRVYSIDLGFEDGIPKLIELNSQPALFSEKRGKQFQEFQEKLADVLIGF